MTQDTLLPEPTGIPSVFRDHPDYFRNRPVEDFDIVVEQPSNSNVESTIYIVKTGTQKKNNYWPMVNIMGPPLRTIWSQLHGAGDNTDSVPLKQANFSVCLYEGDVDDELLEKFPCLVEEQAAFFSYLEALRKHLMRKMVEHDLISKAWKEKERKYIKGNSDAAREEFLAKFMDRSNPLVTVPAEDKKFKNRYFKMKTSIARALKPGPSFEEYLRKLPADDNHVMKKLAVDTMMYIPPRIADSSGEPMDLGTNETQVVFDKSIVIPTFSLKAYDLKAMAGVRGLYNSLVLLRAPRPEEMYMNKRNAWSSWWKPSADGSYRHAPSGGAPPAKRVKRGAADAMEDTMYDFVDDDM